MFKPGQSGNPNGRPKGATSKSTLRIREAYQMLIENNLDNLTLWLEQMADRDPAKAADTMLRLSEYILPKLSRTELTDQDGNNPFANVSFTFNTATNGQEEKGTPKESASQESKIGWQSPSTGEGDQNIGGGQPLPEYPN